MKKLTQLSLAILAASAFSGSVYAANSASAEAQPAAASTQTTMHSDSQTHQTMMGSDSGMHDNAMPSSTMKMSNGEDNVADASYSIGYAIGKNMTDQLKAQGISLDDSNLTEGFSAGINEQKPKLSDEQMQNAMTAFQKAMESKMAAAKTQAEQAAKEQKSAMADNKSPVAASTPSVSSDNDSTTANSK
ncbi:MAG: FKBP-type peptidyl-prolyl cis-trans isomerase N-terminal domain-containing protein [Francisellaceae bacterium]